MPCRQSHRRRLKDHPDRERRAVPHRVGRDDRRRDAGPGGRPSELVDGRQDLGRFGDLMNKGLELIEAHYLFGLPSSGSTSSSTRSR
jgi:hypothetical protein